ncbi:MAG: efflux RND transporter permease subunit, partial [Alphaproteobacteria bacterium]|nr:efflux RND transporter permease subunit [Alphaproteobacteria bacterium]
MVLSDISVKRPVLATVMSLVIVIFGLFGYSKLSVREYPDVDRPIVSVSTVYRGASAAIIESQVTQVLEDAVAGIEGITNISSTSREESSSITIEFNVDRDMDSAANDVRDRVSRAIRSLPDEADAPRIAKSDDDARSIMWLALTSNRQDGLELTDYAERYLVDRLSIVSGVANVRIGGGRRYAIRIWLNKKALAARQLTVQDVESALRRQNIQLPSGRIESSQREISVRTDSSLRSVEDFGKVVVREADGFFVRLSEVAEIELAAENARNDFRTMGRNAIGMGVVKQSKANTLDVATGIKAEMEKLNATLPAGTRLEVAYDQSVFIGRAITEVFIAIGIAMAMVVAVNFVFLRSLTATLIPAVAIPVSVIGSLSVLASLGYSINILTLLALVLAIGLVVDDAIVVLENIH